MSMYYFYELVVYSSCMNWVYVLVKCTSYVLVVSTSCMNELLVLVVYSSHIY